MVHTIVLILGPMRSGGAAVAEVTHTLGVPVATDLYAPGYPTYRLEWEDPFLTQNLRHAIADNSDNGVHDFLELHFRERALDADEMDKLWGTETHTIAVKCPFLALFFRHAVRAAKACNLALKVVQVEREEDAIQASLERSVAPALLSEWQVMNEQIMAELRKIPYDYKLKYENLVDGRMESVLNYAAFLDVNVNERIVDAMERVQQPTSHPQAQEA